MPADIPSSSAEHLLESHLIELAYRLAVEEQFVYSAALAASKGERIPVVCGFVSGRLLRERRLSLAQVILQGTLTFCR